MEPHRSRLAANGIAAAEPVGLFPAPLRGASEAAGGPNGAYHSYRELETALTDLAARFPGLARLTTIGRSLENRRVLALKISDNPGLAEDEAGLLLVGCHHAREWISVEVPLLVAERLLETYDSDPSVREIVDGCELWIVPLLNPDGLEYSIGTYRYWRKNRRDNGDGSFGVDLNRNYGQALGPRRCRLELRPLERRLPRPVGLLRAGNGRPTRPGPRPRLRCRRLLPQLWAAYPLSLGLYRGTGASAAGSGSLGPRHGCAHSRHRGQGLRRRSVRRGSVPVQRRRRGLGLRRARRSRLHHRASAAWISCTGDSSTRRRTSTVFSGRTSPPSWSSPAGPFGLATRPRTDPISGETAGGWTAPSFESADGV